MFQRISALLLCGALLSGCSQFATHEALQGTGDSAHWKLHKQQLSPLNSWQINGKVGLRVQTPEKTESGSATLFWLQRQDYYDIRLSGPLGRGATRLVGHPQQVELEIAGQGRYSASSPEALLQENLGWNLPVSHLFWWIRGLPAPDSRSRLQLDSSSRLSQLEQDNWHVQYLSYQQYDTYWLPERLKLQGPNIEITLVVKDWQPRTLGQ